VRIPNTISVITYTIRGLACYIVVTDFHGQLRDIDAVGRA